MTRVLRQLVAEVQILAAVKRDAHFVVGLRECAADATCIYLFQDLAPGGDLYELLLCRLSLSEEHARFYLVNVILGLRHLHAMHVIWRDLKPENLVFCATGYLKIVDMGLAKRLRGPAFRTFTQCGTVGYMAPEVMDGTGYGTSVDYWSLGVLLYEMLSGATPFNSPGDSYLVTYRRALAGLPALGALPFEDGVVSVLASLLEVYPELRLGSAGAGQVEAHEWLRGVDWSRMRDQTLPTPWHPPPRPPATKLLSYEEFCQRTLPEASPGTLG